MSEKLVTGIPIDVAQHYHEVGVWKGETLWQLFARAISGARGSDARALSDDYRSESWAEFGQQVASAAALFSSQGVAKGDVVIVHMPNCVAYLEAIAALWRLGAVPLFALAAHGGSDLASFAKRSGARHYVAAQSLPNIRENRHHQASVAHLQEHAPEVSRTLVDVTGEYPWGSSPAPVPEAVEVDPSGLAFLQLSGGTTGEPKLIPRTHDDYLYSVRASIEVCDLDEASTMLVVLPASHNFTMSSPGILGAVHVGARIVFTGSPEPAHLLEVISACCVTHTAMVPPMVLMLLNHAGLPALKAAGALDSLKTIWVGGAKLSESVALRITPELGCTLQQVFGMAEGLVIYTRLHDTPEEAASYQGVLMSSYDEIRIVDDHDNDVATGEAGHLLARGAYTIRNYYRSPEADRTSFTAEGFYRTGDIVSSDEQGRLTVRGRAKDHINRGGEKIAPEHVENVLLTHPGVHDATVVGRDDDVLGERICAYVILREGRAGREGKEDSITPAKLRRHVRESGTASFAVPDDIMIVTEFPTTAVGKVSKRGLSAH